MDSLGGLLVREVVEVDEAVAGAGDAPAHPPRIVGPQGIAEHLDVPAIVLGQHFGQQTADRVIAVVRRQIADPEARRGRPAVGADEAGRRGR